MGALEEHDYIQMQKRKELDEVQVSMSCRRSSAFYYSTAGTRECM
jgi:hypothetical protein